MSDDRKIVDAWDVSDENPLAVANQLRALQRDVRDGFDGIGRALQALTRIEERLHVVIDRQNHADTRMDAMERRISALETKRPRARKVLK
jgi:hypothetical protein